MKTFALFVAFSLGAFGSIPQLHAQTAGRSETKPTGSQIVRELNAKQDRELNHYITAVGSKVDELELTNDELDAIIAQLTVIQNTDPYQQQVAGFKGDKNRSRTKFPNRDTAKSYVARFKFQKLANELRKLPMEERVNTIVAGIKQPPGEGKLASVYAYTKELLRTGKEAVPFIVQHQFQESYHRQEIIKLLATLGDPQGIDYIIEILQTPGDEFARDRPVAAEALANFRAGRVVVALVQALQDDTTVIGNRFQPQISRPGDKNYLAHSFPVRQAAAQSLSQITGKDWGLLFNEDHLTWVSWLNAQDRARFTPADVKRSEEQLEALITALFHAYMSGRFPNHSFPRNALASEEGIQALADDLNQLGPAVVPLIVKEYQAHLAETPDWHDMLQAWTKNILLAMDREDAQKAAETLIK